MIVFNGELRRVLMIHRSLSLWRIQPHASLVACVVASL